MWCAFCSFVRVDCVVWLSGVFAFCGFAFISLVLWGFGGFAGWVVCCATVA